ncbi:MAG: TM0106 family RecB-like putative nuclease, partial [Planctomycetota bacterium]|nr:TM0106 family RecB-like putative nuclease [Planctomycetota bacterium]
EKLREQGLGILVVPTGGGVESHRHATLAALREGHDVVYQGALAGAQFGGFADFLVRVDTPSDLGEHSYEIWDTKLSLSPKPEHLIQLCAYAEMLASVQGLMPERVAVVTADGKVHFHRTEDFLHHVRALRGEFLAFQSAFDSSTPPDPEPGAKHGRWEGAAEAFFADNDHLALVAGMRRTQIVKLRDAGIGTRRDLAATPLARVPKMADATFDRLRTQAQLQVASEGIDVPLFEVVRPSAEDPRRGLALLPLESHADVYFDMEGFPSAEGGLEYLFGVVVRDGGAEEFRDWWAHDREEEKQAFEEFVDWVHARWRANPDMHVYHYNSYEPAALKRLMGRHGTREDQVDDLLRGHVFVDLYRVVQQGVRVGTTGYSLKDLERLYRDAREGDVKSAGGSIEFYDRWLTSGEPRDWRASPTLQAIREYNAVDCRSTGELCAWLRTRQAEAGIAFVAPHRPEGKPEEDSDNSPEDLVAVQLLERSRVSPATASIDALLGQLVEFHRREARPVHWAMYERSEYTDEQHAEEMACLGPLELISSEGLPVKRSTAFRYRIAVEQETKLTQGADCFIAQNLRVSAEIHALDLVRQEVVLKIGPKPLTLLDGAPPRRVNLIPKEHVGAREIEASILRVASSWLEDGDLPGALETLLNRERPNIRDQEDGPLVRVGETGTQGLVRLVTHMEETTLCVQGPPGTGKTYSGAHAILALLRDGKRVGIASNSHKAICNLLSECMAIAPREFECAEAGGDPEDRLFTRHAGRLVASKDVSGLLDRVRLVGGTAWLFSREDMRGRLDYLFVDEAGQVSLANVVGMAPSARNVVLLGDPSQLAQPSKGTHPGESGMSALTYYLNKAPTIPPERGVFLETSYRLHPRLSEVLSPLVYEGRLRSDPSCALRLVQVPPNGGGEIPLDAGILFVPVVHEGNSQGSVEEVEAVARIIETLLGRDVTDKKGQPAGRLALEDILVVAPYNLQVSWLRDRLPSDARVGTVDKFQGQEARVVIVSACASEAGDAARGLEFVLDKNRWNVALSRAQSIAIVVGSPKLGRTACSSIRQMELVNLFARVTSCAAAI